MKKNNKYIIIKKIIYNIYIYIFILLIKTYTCLKKKTIYFHNEIKKKIKKNTNYFHREMKNI